MKIKPILTLVTLAGILTVSSAQLYRPMAQKQEFSGRMIVRLKPTSISGTPAQARAAGVLRTQGRQMLSGYYGRFVPETDEFIVDLRSGENENQFAQRLLASGAFQYVEPDWIVYTNQRNPNDPRFSSQWHHPKTETPLAWNLFAAENSAVTVAIVDTGVRLDHEDFQGRLVSGANSSNGTAIPQSSGANVNDQNGHGTHCAGIAAATGNNALGVAGMGWGLRIMPIRVTPSGTGGAASLSALTAGARWAADNGARVVSTSFSGVSSSSIQTTGAYLRARNVLYFYAAGNDNRNLSTFDHPDVNVVGATDSNDNKASFSAYGRGVDVFAPGVSILATYVSSPTSYASLSGTSMATPCAAGLAGLLVAANPNMATTQLVETAMYSGAQDLGTAGNDDYWGWGRINANRSVRWMYANVPFAPSAASVIMGTPTAGNLDSLKNNDANRWVVSSVNGRVVVRMTLTTTLRGARLGQLEFEDGVNLNNVTRTVQVRDQLSNTYTKIKAPEVSTVESGWSVPISAGMFRNDGAVDVQITYSGLRTPFQVSFDVANLRTPAP